MIRSLLTALAIVLFILLTVWSVHLSLASRMSPALHERTLRYLTSHQGEIANQRYLTVIDFTKPSYVKRMFVHDLETKEVQRYLVAHGENSGFIYTTEFSNQIGSHQSCRGLFLTGEAYDGDYGPALRLHGLEEGINDNAYRRDIVIHGASWVSYGAIFENGGRLGRSWGCPAVPLGDAAEVVDRLKGGSLLYIHAGED
jgi:hypothetical protein